MELVVVNGASNIARSVVRGLASGGKYNRVRLVDYRPHKQAVYAFQRELQGQGHRPVDESWGMNYVYLSHQHMWFHGSIGTK